MHPEFAGRLVNGNYQGTRSFQIGPLSFSLTRERDGTWSATALFGKTSGHKTAKEAVLEILDSSKSLVTYKTLKLIREEFEKIEW